MGEARLPLRGKPTAPTRRCGGSYRLAGALLLLSTWARFAFRGGGRLLPCSPAGKAVRGLLRSWFAPGCGVVSRVAFRCGGRGLLVRRFGLTAGGARGLGCSALRSRTPWTCRVAAASPVGAASARRRSLRHAVAAFAGCSSLLPGSRQFGRVVLPREAAGAVPRGPPLLSDRERRNAVRVSPGDEPGRVVRERMPWRAENPRSVSGMKQGRRAR